MVRCVHSIRLLDRELQHSPLLPFRLSQGVDRDKHVLRCFDSFVCETGNHNNGPLCALSGRAVQNIAHQPFASPFGACGDGIAHPTCFGPFGAECGDGLREPWGKYGILNLSVASQVAIVKDSHQVPATEDSPPPM